LKLLEENIVVHLCEFGSGNGFLDMIPKAQGAKEKQVNKKFNLLCFK
jgi:hypothetical protein